MKPTVEQSTIDFVCGFEGFSATPYSDSGKFAIGYGFDYLNGYPVTMETPPMTMAEAKVIVGQKLLDFEKQMYALISPSVTLTQNQHDALIDFVYNEGAGALQKSNLLKNINGHAPVTLENFTSWDEDQRSGKLAVDPVLTERRTKEYDLYVS